MKRWEECKADINKVKPDKEMAKSLLKMMSIRLKLMETAGREEFTSIVVEGYYEIIKEGITAIMALDGCKTLSHEALISYLAKFYKEFSENEILFIDDLRRIRNKIAYKGFFVRKDYLDRNEHQIKAIIGKLQDLISKEL